MEFDKKKLKVKRFLTGEGKYLTVFNHSYTENGKKILLVSVKNEIDLDTLERPLTDEDFNFVFRIIQVKGYCATHCDHNDFYNYLGDVRDFEEGTKLAFDFIEENLKDKNMEESLHFINEVNKLSPFLTEWKDYIEQRDEIGGYPRVNTLNKSVKDSNKYVHYFKQGNNDGIIFYLYDEELDKKIPVTVVEGDLNTLSISLDTVYQFKIPKEVGDIEQWLSDCLLGAKSEYVHAKEKAEKGTQEKDRLPMIIAMLSSPIYIGGYIPTSSITVKNEGTLNIELPIDYKIILKYTKETNKTTFKLTLNKVETILVNVVKSKEIKNIEDLRKYLHEVAEPLLM
ncbi:hypothetical protein HOT02_gp042 [Staphylococcus phage phiSA_BS2]|uniref:Uncharacterized protein n=1 Tax=Staphylococcus phage phiSA_BS2 TaxID=2126724 RepID=A0A2R3ZXK4_9CAUD|nr:hypothetical protein HOT02_gp042 [Staphylococcus phage phiSA_BS2]AVR55487.1 hypothetical protein phiSABS2_42 [Staphylococcus phage phiSA_BS2]